MIVVTRVRYSSMVGIIQGNLTDEGPRTLPLLLSHLQDVWLEYIVQTFVCCKLSCWITLTSRDQHAHSCGVRSLVQPELHNSTVSTSLTENSQAPTPLLSKISKTKLPSCISFGVSISQKKKNSNRNRLSYTSHPLQVHRGEEVFLSLIFFCWR